MEKKQKKERPEQVSRAELPPEEEEDEDEDKQDFIEDEQDFIPED